MVNSFSFREFRPFLIFQDGLNLTGNPGKPQEFPAGSEMCEAEEGAGDLQGAHRGEQTRVPAGCFGCPEAMEDVSRCPLLGREPGGVGNGESRAVSRRSSWGLPGCLSPAAAATQPPQHWILFPAPLCPSRPTICSFPAITASSMPNTECSNLEQTNLCCFQHENKAALKYTLANLFFLLPKAQKTTGPLCPTQFELS